MKDRNIYELKSLNTLEKEKLFKELDELKQDLLVNKLEDNLNDATKNSSFSESFPWFVDETGQPFDLDKKLELEDGVQVISRYLKTRELLNVKAEHQVSLRQLLGQFYEDKTENPNFLELINHIQVLYKKEGDNILKQVNPNLSINDLNPEGQGEIPKYFGEYGEKSLNSVTKDLLNLKIADLENYNITVNPINLISVGLMYKILLKVANKHYVNAQLPKEFSAEKIIRTRLVRQRQFFFFSTIIAPSLSIAWGFYNKQIFGGSPISVIWKNTNNDLIEDTIQQFKDIYKPSNSIIFVGLKKIFKYRIVKRLSLLLLLSSLVYVFGLENSLILIIYIVGLIKKNKVYIFIMTFILCILGILYAIWNLYVLHKYYISHNKNEEIFIPKTLPKFVIVKLEDLKMFSETEVGLNVFKDMYYTQIIFCIIFAIIYLVLIFYYI